MRSLECSWRLTRREREKYYHNETLGKANYPHMRLFLTCSLQLGAHKGKHATGPEILNSNSIYTEHRGSSTTACNSRSYSCLEITTGRLSGTPAMCARTCSPAVCHWTSRRRIRAQGPYTLCSSPRFLAPSSHVHTARGKCCFSSDAHLDARLLSSFFSARPVYADEVRSAHPRLSTSVSGRGRWGGLRLLGWGRM
jgi:hypothetical protein